MLGLASRCFLNSLQRLSLIYCNRMALALCLKFGASRSAAVHLKVMPHKVVRISSEYYYVLSFGIGKGAVPFPELFGDPVSAAERMCLLGS